MRSHSMSRGLSFSLTTASLQGSPESLNAAPTCRDQKSVSEMGLGRPDLEQTWLAPKIGASVTPIKSDPS